jgi:hypothetical protein
MLSALLLSTCADVPTWVQHDATLGRRELVKIEARGEHTGEWLRTIREDGVVTTWTVDGRTTAFCPTFRLSRDQLRSLKSVISHTDFDKLMDGPLAKVDPESVDAPDDLFVLRKGRKLLWWSNAVYDTEDEASAFIRFVIGLKEPKSDKSPVLTNVSKVSTWG